jgi:hypothetical protein
MLDNTGISEELTSSIIREYYNFKLEVTGYFEASIQLHGFATKATFGLFFILTSKGTSILTQPLILCYY